MSIIKAIDKIIHKIPILPEKLQGTLIDRVWEKISGYEEKR